MIFISKTRARDEGACHCGARTRVVTGQAGAGDRGETILRCVLVSFLEPGDMKTTTTFIVSFVSLCC